MSEQTTTTLSPFHERLIAEKDSLDEKINKLQPFLESQQFSTIPNYQQILLRIQFHAMTTYSQCLTERLGLLQ